MGQKAMELIKALVRIQMTNAKQMELALFVRPQLHSHIPAALSSILFAMQERQEHCSACVTLARPQRVAQLPVRYVTVLAMINLFRVEPVSVD